MALADFIQALQEQDVVYSTPPQPSIRVIPPEQPCIKVIPPEDIVKSQPAPKVIKLKIKQKQVDVYNNMPQSVSDFNSEPTTVQQPVVQQTTQPVQQQVVQQPIQTQPTTVVQQPVVQPVQQTVQTVQQPNVVPEQSVQQPVVHITSKQPIVQQQPQQPVQQVQQPQVIVQQPVQPEQPVVQQVVQQPVVQEQPVQVQQPVTQVVQQPIVQENPVVQDPIQSTESKELSDEDLFNNTGTEYSKKSIWLDYYDQAKRSRKSNPIVDRMKVGRFTITPDNKVLLLPDYDIVGKDPDDVLKDKWF